MTPQAKDLHGFFIPLNIWAGWSHAYRHSRCVRFLRRLDVIKSVISVGIEKTQLFFQLKLDYHISVDSLAPSNAQRRENKMYHHNARSLSRPNLVWRFMVTCGAVMMMSATSQGDLVFDFEDETDGAVLATLDVSSSFLSDVLDFNLLSFTNYGIDRLGLVEPPTNVEFLALDFGNLIVSDGAIIPVGPDDPALAVTFGPDPQGIVSPAIVIRWRTNETGQKGLTKITFDGDLPIASGLFVSRAVAVPEPSVAWLLVAACCGGGVLRRRILNTPKSRQDLAGRSINYQTTR